MRLTGALAQAEAAVTAAVANTEAANAAAAEAAAQTNQLRDAELAALVCMHT